MKPRSKKTLQKYKLTSQAFRQLWDSQGGSCGICGVSEDELTTKHQDWAADQILHIDHEHGSSPPRVRGLLCKDCNYDLEAFIRKTPLGHPAGRGLSVPRNDPRFRAYLKRTAAPKGKKSEPQDSRNKDSESLDEWSHRFVTVSFKDGSERTGTLMGLPEGRAFQLFAPFLDGEDYDDLNHSANQVYFIKNVVKIREVPPR